MEKVILVTVCPWHLKLSLLPPECGQNLSAGYPPNADKSSSGTKVVPITSLMYTKVVLGPRLCWQWDFHEVAYLSTFGGGGELGHSCLVWRKLSSLPPPWSQLSQLSKLSHVVLFTPPPFPAWSQFVPDTWVVLGQELSQLHPKYGQKLSQFLPWCGQRLSWDKCADNGIPMKQHIWLHLRDNWDIAVMYGECCPSHRLSLTPQVIPDTKVVPVTSWMWIKFVSWLPPYCRQKFFQDKTCPICPSSPQLQFVPDTKFSWDKSCSSCPPDVDKSCLGTTFALIEEFPWGSIFVHILGVGVTGTLLFCTEKVVLVMPPWSLVTVVPDTKVVPCCPV